MKYKVFFHAGDELSLKTTVSRGVAWLDGEGLHVRGSSEVLIPKAQIIEAELFRLHGLGRVIRLEHRQGRIFLSVVRLMVGQFAFINFKTGRLHKELSEIATHSAIL